MAVSIWRPALAIVLTAVVLTAPSFLLGTMPSHSAPQNLLWAEQFAAQVRAGILYPRWMPESFDGLGAPTFYFYPPLTFWADALLSIVTFNRLPAFDRAPVLWALLSLLSGWAMYAWLRSQRAERIAVIGAIGYMAAPYHLLDHYIRGALAEFAAYVVLPLVVLAVRRVADRRAMGVPVLAAAYAGLPLTHLPTALLISLVVLPSYVAFLAWRLGRAAAVPFLWHCLMAGTLGVGIAAAYLVPALTLQHWISIKQLWAAGLQVETWFLLTPDRWLQPFYMINIIAWISASWTLAAAGVLVALRRGSDPSGARTEVTFWALLCLASVLLMSGLLPWFWSAVPFVSKVQFPWRLLIVVEFAAITGLCLLQWRGLRLATLAVFGLAVVAGAPGIGLLVGGITRVTTLAAEGRGPIPKEADEYLPVGYPSDPATGGIRKLGVDELRDVMTIACAPAARRCEATNGPFGEMHIETAADRPIDVVVRRFYFPAWQLAPTHAVAPTDPLRLISFTLPPGRHSLWLRLENLPAERWGWAVSGLSFVLLFALVLKERVSIVAGPVAARARK